MPAEIIKKFETELLNNADLKERLARANLSHENLDELVSFAKKAGFDFTLDELETSSLKSTTVELPDDELDKAVGGLTDSRERWKTTIAFSCEKWAASSQTWLATRGQCGSCRHWENKTGILVYLGAPGICKVNTEPR